jgi:hypothetical protein
MMQTSPCWIWSGTDFFITTAGIIGTETTIGGFQPYEKKLPIGYRIRTAMQYASSIDGYISFLVNGNSGDYANSWLFGDIKTNEIARLELGLKYHKVDRTKNGYLIGFNAPFDPRIRNIEVVNSGFFDIRRHQGARRVRLEQLMKKYKGKLNIELAKKILADHYDVYLKKDNNPCSRTICSHYDIDKREYMSQQDRPVSYAPHGAVDGIVCDDTLAREMTFIGRFGNSCGIPFIKEKYCRENIQFSSICYFLKDRPSQPWTKFQVNGFKKNVFDNYLNYTLKLKKYKENISKLISNKNLSHHDIVAENDSFFNTFDNNTDIKSDYYTDGNINYVHNDAIINIGTNVKKTMKQKTMKQKTMKQKTMKQKTMKQKTMKNTK